MIEFWHSFAYTTKVSTIGFFVTIAVGLLSMGFLGLGLYYLASPLLRSYPSLDNLKGDSVWPALILVGMVWSVGFVIGGITWHYLKEVISSLIILRFIYILILWLWAALLWYFVIKNNVS
ncbi:MAG: hypothetical protein AB8F94_27150 [Saprospiraceae bacterium]